MCRAWVGRPMARLYESILDTVGKTPLVRLSSMGGHLSCPIYLKVEAMNPGGSVKDRIAITMVAVAEEAGLLKPGGTIVEPTSGNTGVGLAMVAARRGYKLIFTLPDKMSREKAQLLEAYGAKVVICPTAVAPDHPDSYYSVANRITAEIPDAYQPNQYYNQANPDAHYASTGPEIWEDTDGKVTHVVIGMGTGGTISGVGRYLKEMNPDIHIIGVDTEGSILKETFEGTEVPAPHPYQIEGIGEDIIPETLHFNVIDEVIRCGDGDAFITGRRLVREEGILSGSSTGAAVYVALGSAEGLGPDDLLVVLQPDSGNRYLSKFLNDQWMRENQYITVGNLTLGDMLDLKPHDYQGIFAVEPGASVREAYAIMKDQGVSQVPVLDAQECVGRVTEAGVLDVIMSQTDGADLAVREVMEKPFAVMREQTIVEGVLDLFRERSGCVLVTGIQGLRGIITRADVVEYYFQEHT